MGAFLAAASRTLQCNSCPCVPWLNRDGVFAPCAAPAAAVPWQALCSPLGWDKGSEGSPAPVPLHRALLRQPRHSATPWHGEAASLVIRMEECLPFPAVALLKEGLSVCWAEAQH